MMKKIKKFLKPKYVSYKQRKKLLQLKLLKLKFRLKKNREKTIYTNKIKKRNIELQNIESLQKIIDSLSYPPNHDYDLRELRPKGELKFRLEQIKALESDFFRGDKFLDIGCNKGFFSLLASRHFNNVCSIDNDPDYTDLCKKLKQNNMGVELTSFRDFITNERFDKILLGNVHHYLFRECKGWDWIYKLAVISSGIVIIEGPIDMTCKDMNAAIPDNLKRKFTYEKFMNVMLRFFTLEARMDSILPQRYVMLFKRKKDVFDNAYQFDDFSIRKILKDGKKGTVFLTVKNNKIMIAKVIKNPTADLKNQINIARMSPISNGLIGTIYNGDAFIGWLEEYNDDKICRYKENQKEIFKKMCEHNIFLSRLGYFDTDIATINFFNKNLKLFDKGSVIPIKSLNKKLYEDYHFIYLKNSFDFIDENTKNLIKDSLKSKDSLIIEQTFADLKNKYLGLDGCDCVESEVMEKN